MHEIALIFNLNPSVYFSMQNKEAEGKINTSIESADNTNLLFIMN